MIAIKVTAKIKRQNLHDWIQKVDQGTIVLRNDYPNRFYVEENIIGGYKQRTDLHELDGWRPFIRTSFNELIQKETRNIVKVEDAEGNITHYTYKIKDLTQEQIDALAEEKEENEAREKMDIHIFKGRDLFEKCYRKIWRRRHKDSDANNKLTQSEERKLMQWFSPVFQWLNLGNFHQAKKEISKAIADNQTELDAVQGMINTATWLENEILDYFNNNYDL